MGAVVLCHVADGGKIGGTAQSGGKDGPRNEARLAQADKRSTREHAHRVARIGKRRETSTP